MPTHWRPEIQLPSHPKDGAVRVIPGPSCCPRVCSSHPKFHLPPGQDAWEPGRPWRVGQGSFLRLGLSQNFFQDLEAKRPGTGASTTAYCPDGPQELAGVRGRGA